MESSTPTEQLDPAGAHGPEHVATAELKPSLMPSNRGQCPACAAAVGADQRYCVECGQRLGPARLPFMDELAERARAAPAVSTSPRRPRLSLNSTLIAGIGTLLLALGIGVLIGRSGQSSSAKTGSVQVVTVPSSGAASTTPSAESQSPTANATKATKPAGGSSAKSTSASRSRSKAPAAPAPKVVKVGTPGKGPGYQNGHFTGNFFGE